MFFAAGALISGASALALAFPGSWLEPLWRLNPDARSAFTRMGPWAILLMVAVTAACAGAAVGLWTDRRWGHRLAVGVLGTNLLGDFLNAVVRGDLRTLIGLPIGGAMLVYLLSRRIRYRFRPPSASESRSGGAPMDEAKRSHHPWAALLCGGLGLWLGYAVWSRQPGLQVPQEVGYLAARAFVAAGLTLLLQARGYTRAATAPAFLLVAALAGIGGWIGFGRGSRRCEASLGALAFVPRELVCRVVFGTGAVLTGLIAVLMLRSLLKGGSAPPRRAT